MTVEIMTSSWFTKLDERRFCRIGISRGTPRGYSGYKRYPQLNPGPWLKSVSAHAYIERYNAEVLDRLSPRQVVDDLMALADGRVPALLCFEPANPRALWCHRGLVAAWLKDHLDLDVFEID